MKLIVIWNVCLLHHKNSISNFIVLCDFGLFCVHVITLYSTYIYSIYILRVIWRVGVSIYFNCAAHFIWHCHTVFHYSLVASAAAVFFHICFIIYYGSYNTQTNKHFIAWAEKQHASHRYKSHLYTSISSEPTARLKKKLHEKKYRSKKNLLNSK